MPRLIQRVSLYSLIPNMITLLALCLGISAIRYALDDKMQIASLLIITAGIFDGLDGRIARLMKSTSKFGAELDSLSDIVSFGVAPSIVLYLWSLHFIPYKGVGWAVVLIFIICSALRLAKFNTLSKSNESMEYFSGVPMPVSAALSLVPLICSFKIFKSWSEISPYYIAVYMLILSILMIAPIPIYSFKKVNVKKEYAKMVLIGFGIYFACLLLDPWIFIPLTGVVYISVIPFSIYSAYKKKNLRK